MSRMLGTERQGEESYSADANEGFLDWAKRTDKIRSSNRTDGFFWSVELSEEPVSKASFFCVSKRNSPLIRVEKRGYSSGSLLRTGRMFSFFSGSWSSGTAQPPSTLEPPIPDFFDRNFCRLWVRVAGKPGTCAAKIS